jgi:hypothetical protein
MHFISVTTINFARSLENLCKINYVSAVKNTYETSRLPEAKTRREKIHHGLGKTTKEQQLQWKIDL